jgi:hypothetical protein
MPRFPSLAAFLAAASIVVAACGTGAQSPTSQIPSALPPGSGGPSASGGTAACPTAPAPGDLSASGWGPPASPPTVIPVVINSGGELICGSNRLLFTFLDQSNRPVGSPDRSASIAIYDLGRDPSKPIATADGTFVWAIENERGVYVANVDFPEAGTYGVELRTSASGSPTETIRLTFDVQPTNGVAKVGQPAPAVKTPTLADVGGDASKISTDSSPDKAFYETSIDQALASHEPFVVVFATPKFCVSAQCGPTLDRIKPYVSRYPSVTFINVEPYKLKEEAGSLQADLDANGQLQPVEATIKWGLLSEPWVFVVDRQGIVRGSFELIFSDQELTAALDSVK